MTKKEQEFKKYWVTLKRANKKIAIRSAKFAQELLFDYYDGDPLDGDDVDDFVEMFKKELNKLNTNI